MYRVSFNLTMKFISLFTTSLCRTAIALLLLAVMTPLLAQNKLPQPREEKLLNGLKVLLWSDPTARDVSVKVRIHAGAAFDPQGKEGVMKMLADNIFPNEVSRDYFRDDLDGGLEIETNYDYIQINASSTSGEFLSMLETLSAAIANPTIDKPTTAKLREALLAKVKLLEADPAYVGDQAVAKRLFGTFPYGRPRYGNSESVAKIDFADLIDAKQRFLTADNATIAVSGNFEKAYGYRLIRRLFGAWLKSDKRVPSTFRQPDAPATDLVNIASPNAEVSAIRFAVRGTSRNDKEFVASKVFARILEARFLARVPSKLSKDVFVRSEEHTLPGMIVAGFAASQDEIGTGNGKIDAGALLAKTLSDLISEAEFQVAKIAFATEWSKRDAASFWLDADTYKSGEPGTQIKIADEVSLDGVRAFAARVAKLPLATVLVNSPAK